MVHRLAAVTGLVVGLALLGAPAATARNVRVSHVLFGAHDTTVGGPSYSRIHEGSIRLWDAGVRWEQVETHQGVYNWSRLDQLVTDAQHAHAQVTMVVAMTPRWYSSSDTAPPRRLAPYKRFAAALMKRYRNFHGARGIAAYQVWNEPNIKTFYSGSMGKLAALTRALAQVRNRYDPHAKVVAPSMVTRLGYEQKGIASYYRQRVGGVPVWRFVNATAFSLYPLARVNGHIGGPEDYIALLNQVKRILHNDHVPASKAIWNTEINYGLTSGGVYNGVRPLTATRQAANVMRTYLLSAAHGVRRVFWYRYDWGKNVTGGVPLGNTRLSDTNNAFKLTAAGHAYARVQKWMHGTLVGPTRKARPCQRNRQGTYTCVVRDSTGTRRIYWNPYRTASVRLPRGVHHLQGVLGAISTVRPRQLLSVNFKPVLVYR
jgi:hypothetical protein